MTDVIMEIVDIFSELSHESQQTHGGKFSEEIYQEGHCEQ